MEIKEHFQFFQSLKSCKRMTLLQYCWCMKSCTNARMFLVDLIDQFSEMVIGFFKKSGSPLSSAVKVLKI